MSNTSNEDLINMISAMSNEEMESLLLDLSGSQFWPAILKYYGQRAELAKNSLMTLDPFKDQTQMARFQGLLAGITDLQTMVAMIDEKKTKVEAGVEVPEAKKTK